MENLNLTRYFTTVGDIIVGILGIVFATIGWFVWKKEKITFFHSYHYDKVFEKDKSAFCTVSGWGIITVSIGLLVTLLIYTGSKYNH